MNVTEMLERIEKLPSEWRHPLAKLASNSFITCSNTIREIVFDLHSATIVRKLCERGWFIYLGAERWKVTNNSNDVVSSHPTYALALLSAAEAVVKEGGG